VRNFDLSSVVNQFSASQSDTSRALNFELKKNFELLLEQAKKTEIKMKDLIESSRQPDASVYESTDCNNFMLDFPSRNYQNGKELYKLFSIIL